jgi:methylated-DNA-[protein]-cysteine S-methyltransferase
MITNDDELDIATLLAPSAGGSETLDRLHRRLAESADRDGLLDIAYRTIDTPLGSLLLAATETGLVRVAFEGEDHDKVLATLTTKLSPRILRAPKRLDKAAFEIDQYFAGARTEFDLALDFSLSNGFRQSVQRYLPTIAYGQTQSYAEVAQRIGHPNAARAVGTACATNALPVVVPCHRVIRTDGTLGGYAGGIEAKTTLLKLEAAAGRMC